MGDFCQLSLGDVLPLHALAEPRHHTDQELLELVLWEHADETISELA